jgi:hypothetical protein
MVKKAMKDNRIFDLGEATNAIEFVEQLLEMQREHTEATESFATTTINHLRIAKERVTELYHDVNSLDID